MSTQSAGNLDERFQGYDSSQEARSWLEANLDRLREFFSSELVRDYVFAPFKKVFKFDGAVTEQRVRTVIAATALANAVLAGIPGKLGIGVCVSMSLEAFMAFQIARHVGYKLERISDVWGLLGVAAGSVLGILVVFKQILGVLFSFFNLVGALPATFLSEYFATTLLGVIFWLGFEEGKKVKRFTVPRRIVLRAVKLTYRIVKHQWSILRTTMRLEIVKLVGSRFKAFLSGELALDRPRLRGDVYVSMAMAYVLARHSQQLDGPLGELFIKSIYRTHPQLEGCSVAEIADYMDGHDAEALQGTMNLVKGEMFEQMVALRENSDGDAWEAMLHEDRSHPGSDITFVNSDTGESIEISLKATMDKAYIEEALRNYPDIPIQATDEVTGLFEHTSSVQASGIDHANVREVTESSFEELLEELPSIAEGAATGVSIAAFVALYPFLVARLRGRISSEQLNLAVQRVTGQAAAALVPKLLFAAALGPIYGWYLLARMSFKATEGAEALAAQQQATRGALVYTEDGWVGGLAPAG